MFYLCSSGETEFTGLACKLVKAFIDLLTVDDEFNGFDACGGHKTSVQRLVGRPKVARLGGGGKDRKKRLFIVFYVDVSIKHIQSCFNYLIVFDE